MRVLWLMRSVVLRRLINEWQRNALLTLMVALAIAAFIAIFDAGERSVASFDRASALLGGEEVIEFRGTERFLSEDAAALAAQAAGQRGSMTALLRLQGLARLRGVEVPLEVSGVDPLTLSAFLDGDEALSEVHAAASEDAVRELNLSPGESLEVLVDGRTLRVTIGLMRPERQVPGRRVVLAISDLQRALQLEGKLSSVLFTGLDAEEGAVLRKKISELQSYGKLSTDTELTGNADRRARAVSLLSAFRMNIAVMLFLTTVVCAFCVFQSAQLSITRLRGEIAVARTLGASRRLIIGIVAAEAVFVGAIGTLIGLTAGRPLSQLLTERFFGTVSAVYNPTASNSSELLPSIASVALSFLVGEVVCLAGVLIPAVRASRIRPSLSTRQAHDFAPPRMMRALAVTCTIGAVSLACSEYALRSGSALPAYGAALGILLSIIALSGSALFLVVKVGQRFALTLFRAPGLFSLSSVAGALPSNTLAVATGAIGLSLLIGLSLMVESFRHTLESWVEYTLKADLFVRAEGIDDPERTTTIPAGAVAAISNLPQIRSSTRTSSASYRLGATFAIINGIAAPDGSPEREYRMVQGRFDPARFNGGDDALLSESAARKLTLRAGDTLDLKGTSFKVRGIFKDFASERPTVVISEGAFQVLFPGIGVRTIAVTGRAPVSLPELEAAIHAAAPGIRLAVQNNAELKRSIFEVFDQTFAITTAMRALMAGLCVVAFFVAGVQALWERKREARTIQVLGATRRQLALAVAGEGIIVTVPTILLGVTAGYLLARLLIDSINPLSFGWTLDFYLSARSICVPIAVIVGGIALPALAAGFMAPRIVRRATLADE